MSTRLRNAVGPVSSISGAIRDAVVMDFGICVASRPRDIEYVVEAEGLGFTHAWMAEGHQGPLHPLDGITRPEPDKVGAYTWNKAPRLGGEVVETGAIARQLAGAQPLVRDAVGRHGGSVYTRVLARLIELARVVPMVEDWLKDIQPGDAFCVPSRLPDEGRGTGLSEAARGCLGHWIVVTQGRIANYQIVAPTGWNFSPRDAVGTPGALEQALVGAPVLEGEKTPVSVQHIVRSFDPCMVCTVH